MNKHKIVKSLSIIAIVIAIVGIIPAKAHESAKHYLNDHTHYLYSGTEEYFQDFIITAYDLSYQSCQKLPDHPSYGVTASGVSLKDHTRESAMAIAVDPNVIPLGSKVLIQFPGERSKYNGVYTAVDTGGAINGNRIDIFFGDEKENVSQEALEFGRSSAKVQVLN